MTYNTLDYAVQDGILTLTLNRPEQMNAFTVEMANELVAAFTRASDDDAVRAIIVTGSGKAFCAGMDLSVPGNVFGLDESQQPTLDDMRARLDDPAIHAGVRDTGGRVTLAIYNCKKPVIAAINGAAVGIGATMTLAMDVRLASEKARIGFVFGKIGIVPEACSSWFLPRIVGISQALEWVYGADILSAEDAKAGGLVKAVVAPDQLLENWGPASVDELEPAHMDALLSLKPSVAILGTGVFMIGDASLLIRSASEAALAASIRSFLSVRILSISSARFIVLSP